MKTLLCTKNGQVIDDDSVLKFIDPAHSGGEGLYESIQTYHGIPFRLKQHLRRLKSSADASSLSLPFSLEEIESWLHEIVLGAEEENQFIKLVVTPEEVILASRLREEPPEVLRGACAISAFGSRKHPSIKALDIHHSYQARQQANKSGCYEALLVDEDGFVTEGAFSNLFWIKNEKVYSTRFHALPGITQEALIECLDGHYPFEWMKIQISELSSSDEVFVSSSYAVVPITRVNDLQIGKGTVGPITQDILHFFHHLTEKECSI